MPAWLALAFALVVLAASAAPARAAYQFGAEDKIRKIVDLAARSPTGEALYLGYKLKVYSVFLPIYMTDDGYVIGFADDHTRYIPLTAEKIAALQRQGQLPTPLPPYRLTSSDWVEGYFLWVFLLAFGAIVGAIALLVAVMRRRKPAARGVAPLTVAAMARRRNRFVLAGLALALLPVLAIAWLAHGFWLTVIRGPRDATAAEIIAAQARGDDHTWFVLAERPHPLGVDRQVTWRNPQGRVQQTLWSLYVVPGSPNILLEIEGTNYAAIEFRAPYYAWISSRNPFDGTYARAREAAALQGYPLLAPFMLTGSNGSPTVTRTGIAIVAAPLAIVFLLLLRGLFVAIRSLRDPLKTANVRQLLKSSRAAEGLDQLVNEIDAQAARAQLSVKSFGPLLLPSWLIANGSVGFTLMSTQDIIWIVPYTVTTRQLGIKTSERHQIHVVDRVGRRLIISTTDINGGVRRVFSRAPWAVVGPHPDLERAFGKARKNLFTRLAGRRDRGKLIRLVDAQRLAILTQARSGRTA